MKRCIAIGMCCALAGVAYAGSFGVSPTRIDFSKGTRTATVEVSNDDDHTLSFQVKLVEWKQTADGKDEYQDSDGLIYFPRRLDVNAHEKRVIRLGTKGPPPDSEKAYRLFVEEIPEATRSPAKGAEVRVVLRFGVPAFVAPANPRKSFAIESAEPLRGKMRVVIRNDGNESAKFDVLRVMRGDEVLAESAGWHVLPGAARAFEIPIEGAKCVASGALRVTAKAEGMALEREATASALLCERG